MKFRFEVTRNDIPFVVALRRRPNMIHIEPHGSDAFTGLGLNNRAIGKV